MKSLLLTGCLALWLGVGLPAARAAEAAPAAPKIGVVNLQRLMQGDTSYAEQLAALSKQVRAARTAWNQKAQEIQKLQQQLEQLQKVYTPGSPQLTEHQKKMVDLKGEMDQLRSQRQQMSQAGAKLMRETYARVRAEIAAYAREHGYTLILRIAEAKIEDDDPGTIQAQIHLRRVVLFHDEQIDITDAVLERLNAKDESASSAEGDDG